MNNANEARMISSLRDLDNDLVGEMRETQNYVVKLYPIVVTGVEYSVVVNGHHSLEAAKLDGVEPVLHYVASEYADEVERDGAEQWLEDMACDSAWFFTDSGYEVWGLKQARLISSLRDLDLDRIEEMRRTKNYKVTLYRIVYCGVAYLAVVDGHHALEAAKLDGVEPLFCEWPPGDDQHDRLVNYYGAVVMLGGVSRGDYWFFVDSGDEVWG